MQSDATTHVRNEEGGSGGLTLGNAITDKISFYGVTPVAQLSSASQAVAVAQGTTTFSEAKTGMWAFASSTAAAAMRTNLNKVVVLANQLRAELVELGLIKGS
jgi:hypothetical protein